MTRLLITLILCLHLLAPMVAYAQSVVRSPVSYSLQEYGFVLGTALLGGLASFWIKVRK